MRVRDVSSFRPALPDKYDATLRNGSDSFFGLPEWFDLVARFGSDHSRQIGFALDQDAQLALPLFRSLSNGTLSSCTNLYTCEYDVLGNHPEEREAIRALGKQITSNLRPPYIRLEGLDPAATSFSALCSGFRDGGYLVKPYFAWGNWYDRTHADGFESYLQRRPSILKNTWRRKLALLQNSKLSVVQILSPAEDVAPYVTAYQAVQKASWKSAEPYPDFIPNLIRLAAQKDALRMGILSVCGMPAAAQFWIVWNMKAIIFKLVHAKQFEKFSPGTLLTMLMAQHILETDRPEEIDFGRGDDAYKRLWAASRRERWGIEAASLRTPRGLAYAARLIAGRGRSVLKQGRSTEALQVRSTGSESRPRLAISSKSFN